MKKLLPLLILMSLVSAQEVDPYYTRSGDPTELSFPGGYISFGFQLGKNSSGQRFSDFQVTGAMVIPIFGEVPVYPFIGFTFGSRNYKNDTNQTYVDMQISVWSFVTAGIGTGYLITNGSVQKRQKWWGGVSFIPIILTRDKVYLDNEHILSRGGMLVLLLPKFGNSFYP